MSSIETGAFSFLDLCFELRDINVLRNRGMMAAAFYIS